MFTPAENAYLNKFGRTQNTLGAAHPGFGTYQEHKHEKVYHYYYQWVCLVFFFQAVSFYIPRYIWKSLEGHRISFCTKDIKDPELDESARNDRVTRMLTCYKRYKNKNNSYCIKFAFLELLNLLIAIFNMYVTDTLMGHRFMDYGSRLLAHYYLSPEKKEFEVDPVHMDFPKMTKCDFYTHSSAGQIDKSDAMCLLPLNILNEKVFLVIWCWFIFLITVSTLMVSYRTVVVLSPGFRTWMLWSDGSKWQHVTSATRNGGYGDWFLIKQMHKNTDPETFNDFLKQLENEEEWSQNNNNTSTMTHKGSWFGDLGSSMKKRASGNNRLREEQNSGSRDTLGTTDSTTDTMDSECKA